MFLSMSTKAPRVDMVELDRLCKLKKLSRAQYIRSALEHYNEKPTAPMSRRGHNLYKGEPVQTIPLLLDPIHIEIINKFQTEYKATKMQIIRQAVIQEALLDGETFKTITPSAIKPEWKGKWVAATDIYKLLNIHRNTLYVAVKKAKLESCPGEKTGHHPVPWYRLIDIIHVCHLTHNQAEELAKTATTATRIR